MSANREFEVSNRIKYFNYKLNENYKLSQGYSSYSSSYYGGVTTSAYGKYGEP